MYFEDVVNLIEVRLPSSNFLFVVCVEGPEERIPFATLDDVLLDFCDSPAIKSQLANFPVLFVAGSTDVVNRSTALRAHEVG